MKLFFRPESDADVEAIVDFLEALFADELDVEDDEGDDDSHRHAE